MNARAIVVNANVYAVNTIACVMIARAIVVNTKGHAVVAGGFACLPEAQKIYRDKIKMQVVWLKAQ